MAKAKENKSMSSACGSHRNMVDDVLTKAHGVEGEVVCIDEHGEENAYATQEDRLDDGLADVNRHNRTLAA